MLKIEISVVRGQWKTQGAYVPVVTPHDRTPLYARPALSAKHTRNIGSMVIMAMEMRPSHMMDEIYKPVQMKIVNTHKRTYDHYNFITNAD